MTEIASSSVLSMEEMGASTTMESTEMEHQHAAHPAAMALVSADQATNTVVASGDWSDPEVWENGALPEAGARIVIPRGMTLTVDSVMPTEFKTIGIHGTLSFATHVDTELRVDTIVSAPHGRFEMGTAANPVPVGVTAKVVFADDGVIDTNWDPEQLSRGAVLQGHTEIHGADTTHRMTLASFPTAGATSIELASVPVNWKVGDQIVITGTQGPTSDEVRTIGSIDGSMVMFSDPLQLDHVPPQPDLNVYVANTTRNVQFSSENAAVSHRGHIMLMHTLDVNIQNAEFSDLGRTDKTRPLDDLLFEFDDAVGNGTSAPVVFTTTAGERTNVRGRYAVHFHRGGVDPNSTPATVAGSVINGSPGWGLVNHSANVDMVNNVTHGVQGAAYYTEVGDEIGSMVGNIAIRTVNPAFTLDDEGAIDPDLGLDRMDFGVDGDGFWLSGHMVSMRDNVSAGASAHGIIIWSDGVIEPDLERGRSSVLVASLENGHLITGRDTIPTWWAPLSEISNNESYGATIGFRSRYVHSAGYLGEIGSAFHTPPDQDYIDTLNPTIDGLTVWGSRDGMLLNYNERMSVKNARLIGVGAPYVQNGGTADTGVGIDMYNEVTRGPGVIENVSIEGYNMGLLAPRQDTWQLNNVQLANTTDMLITEARQAPREMQMTNVTFESLEGTAVADQSAERRNIVMATDFEADAHQPFFFLMPDTITFNGQQLYFDAQAAESVPITQQISHESVRLPEAMIGQTNQQLKDRYGTSFAGAITPSDAAPADFVLGGVIGSIAPDASTTPPLYDMTSEGANGVLVDPGTLANFNGGLPVPGDDEEGDDDNDGDTDAEPDDMEGGEPHECDGDESDESDAEEDDESDEAGDDESEDDPESELGDDELDDDEPDSGEQHDSEQDDDEQDDDEQDDDEPGDNDEPFDSEPDDHDEPGEDGEGLGDDECDEGNEEPIEVDDLDEDGEGVDESEDDEPDAGEQEDDAPDENDEGPGDDDLDEVDEGPGDDPHDDECDEGNEEKVEDDEESDEDDDELIDDEDAGGESDEDDSGNRDSDIGQFQNPDIPTDVNGDGVTTASDALMVINHLNRHASGLSRVVANAIAGYLDVNGDQSATAADALAIINFLNRLAGAAERDVIASHIVPDVSSMPPSDFDNVDDELLSELAADQIGQLS